jgi:hypothetical protein
LIHFGSPRKAHKTDDPRIEVAVLGCGAASCVRTRSNRRVLGGGREAGLRRERHQAPGIRYAHVRAATIDKIAIKLISD